MNGYLLVDKEKGITSFDVVARVRRDFNTKKVGHCGTLDPLATGLLVVFIGEGTKLLEYFVGHDKEYVVKAKFGFVSDSCDADGDVKEFLSEAVADVSEALILDAISSNFIGDIMQVPPKFSALKIDGKRAYELARSGVDFEMKARPVHVSAFEIVKYELPYVTFKINCGSGTYIRSLVHDLGQIIGVGAYVEELRRTRIGDFNVIDANNKVLYSLESLIERFETFEVLSKDYEVLSNGGFVFGKNVAINKPVLALFENKVVGVLENLASGDGIKFAKKFNNM